MIKTPRAIHGVVVPFIFALSSAAFAQITFTAGDLLGFIGTTQSIEEDIRSGIPINVGSPGAMQTWDFSAMTIPNPVVATFTFSSPTGTPFAASFPQANLVQQITTPAQPGFAFYNYFQVTSSSSINLGNGRKLVTPIDTSFVRFQSNNITPLPIAFNNTWTTIETDTTGLFPLAATTSNDTTINTVDAWGRVRLRIGEFDCLRIRGDVKSINKTIVNGLVISTDTETFISYTWIAKSGFAVASAESQDGETNPSFTSARGFGRLTGISTLVEGQTGHAEIPSSFELFQNSPNPFWSEATSPAPGRGNPETTIKYQIPQNGQVELLIFNALGQKVRELVNKAQRAGFYEARWNGTDNLGNPVPSGVYYYRMKSGDFVRTKKMVFLR
jgi:hypothetical protein